MTLMPAAGAPAEGQRLADRDRRAARPVESPGEFGLGRSQVASGARPG
jgi:hypothetical protein